MLLRVLAGTLDRRHWSNSRGWPAIEDVNFLFELVAGISEECRQSSGFSLDETILPSPLAAALVAALVRSDRLSRR
jgi:hypothetical protein